MLVRGAARHMSSPTEAGAGTMEGIAMLSWLSKNAGGTAKSLLRQSDAFLGPTFYRVVWDSNTSVA